MRPCLKLGTLGRARISNLTTLELSPWQGTMETRHKWENLKVNLFQDNDFLTALQCVNLISLFGEDAGSDSVLIAP